MSSIAIQSMTAYKPRWKPTFPNVGFCTDTDVSFEEPGFLKFGILKLTSGDRTIPYTDIQRITLHKDVILHIGTNFLESRQNLWIETETCLYVFLLGEPLKEKMALPFQVESFETFGVEKDESRLITGELVSIPIKDLFMLPLEFFKAACFVPSLLRRYIRKYKGKSPIGTLVLVAIDSIKLFFFTLVLLIFALNIYNPFK